jgi:hypothetical protein
MGGHEGSAVVLILMADAVARSAAIANFIFVVVCFFILFIINKVSVK